MPLFEFSCPACEAVLTEYHFRRPERAEESCPCGKRPEWAGLSSHRHHVALVEGAFLKSGEFVKGTWGSAPKRTRGGTVKRYG